MQWGMCLVCREWSVLGAWSGVCEEGGVQCVEGVAPRPNPLTVVLRRAWLTYTLRRYKCHYLVAGSLYPATLCPAQQSFNNVPFWGERGLVGFGVAAATCGIMCYFGFFRNINHMD